VVVDLIGRRCAFRASPVRCSAPGVRPGGRVTFFWRQKKVTKEEAFELPDEAVLLTSLRR
jgi:hypothetical protein